LWVSFFKRFASFIGVVFSRNFFKIGEIYLFSKINTDFELKNSFYFFLTYEIKKFFMPLEEWRNKQINKILENAG
jgi:hypothetical protein